MFIKTDVHPNTKDDKGIDWVFFADTLNFSFWNLENKPQYLVTYKGTTQTGYLAMCAAINRTLDQGIDLVNPAYFATIDLTTLGNHLKGDGEVPCPLMPQRLECLHQVGKVLNQKYGGRFANLMEHCNGSATALLDLVLEEFPCFRDQGCFNGTAVSFHKRAQILVADIWCLFEGEGKGNLSDIDSLTMFADYRVPQSLQHYGVLSYSTDLLTLLQADKVMESGDQLEMEIRGCSIHAVEMITQGVRRNLQEWNVSSTVNSILVDQFLWGYRRTNAHDMKQFPYHKVRSIYY